MKRNPVCFHGGGEARKKKLGLSRSWKKLLKWLWVALDQVAAFGFKWAGLCLKLKRGNRARTKALVKKFFAGLGSSSVVSDTGILGLSSDLESDSVLAQPEMSLVACLFISGDSLSRFSPPPRSPEVLSSAPLVASTRSKVSNVFGSLSLDTSSSIAACSVL
jgi:hypothetical protein